MNQLKNKITKALDLQDQSNAGLYIKICLGVLVLLSLLMRISLIKFQNGDYVIFSSWYDFVNQHGLGSFKYAFSNYNPPYTYFLYIATLLPVSKIVAIKSLLALFDIIMAISVYCVVKAIRPTGWLAWIAGLVTMFAPTVLVTGVFWGQFDQLYIAFMLFSIYFAIKAKPNSMWTWLSFGLALSVKFQAIFLLPALVIFSLRRIRWYDAYWAFVSFFAVTLLPLFAGRSLSSLLNIYPDQARLFNGWLTLNAPSLYQWFPNSVFPYFNSMAILLTFAAVLLVVISTIVLKKYKSEDLLLTTSLLLYLIPFLLPAMHERYFFPANVFSIVLALAYPRMLYAGVAVASQVIVLFSYCPFLFGTMPVPMPLLTAGMLIIIFVLWARHLLPERAVALSK